MSNTEIMAMIIMSDIMFIAMHVASFIVHDKHLSTVFYVASLILMLMSSTFALKYFGGDLLCKLTYINILAVFGARIWSNDRERKQAIMAQEKNRNMMETQGNSKDDAHE